MSIDVGDTNVELCYGGWSMSKTNGRVPYMQKCYSARVVASAAILPGYTGFSSFNSIAYTNPQAIITED